MSLKKRIYLFFMVLLLAFWSILFGQTVPIEFQFQLLFKILKFERSLNQEPDKQITLAICYQNLYRESLNIKEQCEIYLSQNKPVINKTQVSVIYINLNKESLERRIKEENVDLLYILPIRAYDLKKITEISDKYDVLTITSNEEYSKSGISIAFSLVGNKPQILINTKTSKREGADFSSQLLKLVKIIE